MKYGSFAFGSLVATVFTLAATPTRAQTTLEALYDSSYTHDFGGIVASGFDVDLDGVDDVAVGEPYWGPGVDWTGRVRIYSGSTGVVLATLQGLVSNERYGTSIACLGDINQDGWPDFIIGAEPYLDCGSGICPNGVARVVSGKDFSIVYTFLGDGQGDAFGAHVACAGDVDADGYPDIIVGAIGAQSSSALSNQGMARVFSGRDGSILRTVYGDTVSDNFGYAVAGVGDVDGDGHDDFAVQASCIDWSGNKPPYVHVYSGATGAVLYTYSTVAVGTNFGVHIAAVGDLDGDGHSDFAIGQPAPGLIHIYSGAAGNEMRLLGGTPGFGFTFGVVGDLDHDGFPDLGTTDVNGARFFSGHDWSVLLSIPNYCGFKAPDAWVGPAGDVDHDGFADVIVGTVADITFSSGVVRIQSSRILPPTVYCTAKINSLGCQAAISSVGTASASSSQPFTIAASGVLSNKNGLLFYGTDQQAASVPFGTLCVAGAPVRRTQVQFSNGNPPPIDCSGIFAYDFNARIASGVDPFLVLGRTICAQYWYRDPNTVGASATSDALRFTIGP